MNWLTQLTSSSPVAHAIAVLSLVCVAGMALGSIKVRGVGLGTAGVLFAGIIAGHLGKPVDRHTLEFVKEFGLIKVGQKLYQKLRTYKKASAAGG